ncbi:glycosyltransferase family 4 protein [Terrabacter terrigena]|uniref:Glycosyltransferase family 4 protein n=1 Tax=Terrabacter terrigena TaxID=574718 RepID=A0ABW3N2Q5_9MICO
MSQAAATTPTAAPAVGPVAAPPGPSAPVGPVLYVLKRFPRLSETFVLREVLGLEAAGVRVLVDALLPPEDSPTHAELDAVCAEVRYVPRHARLRDPASARAHLGLVLRRPLRWSALALRARRDDTWRRFVQGGIVAERVRREGVTHVHAHFATASSEVAVVAAALAGVSCSVTAHAKDIYHHDNAPHLARRLSGVDTVVTVSGHNVAHLESVVREGGVRASVRHVPNGVGLGPVADPATGTSLLCVARLVPKKGVDLIVRAAALLADDHPDLVVDIIGDGPLRPELTSLANSLGLADRVRFHGAATADEVQAALAGCRAFVLPCRIDADGDRDGMPTVLVEALARAVPVVSTDVVGIGELVVDGATGLLVPPDDVDALATALDRLLRDPALATSLGLAGRRLVAQRYSPADATAALLDVFAGASGHAGGAA